MQGSRSKLYALEKMAYLIGIPSVMAAGAYSVYNKNVLQADERARKLIEVEERYLAKYPENMIKLQNFQKRVFAIGTVDDLGIPNRDSLDHKKGISKNAAMIRDFVREIVLMLRLLVLIIHDVNS